EALQTQIDGEVDRFSGDRLLGCTGREGADDAAARVNLDVAFPRNPAEFPLVLPLDPGLSDPPTAPVPGKADRIHELLRTDLAQVPHEVGYCLSARVVSLRVGFELQGR